MKKKILLLLTCVCTLSAREWRTPLPHIRHPKPHTSFKDFKACPKQQTGKKWFSYLGKKSKDKKPTKQKTWKYDISGTAFFRHADKALCATTHDADKHCPLAQLLFGKSSFKGQETFASAAIPTPTASPFLILSTLTPDIGYTDRGFILNFNAIHKVNDAWRVGVRARLPLRQFSMKLNSKLEDLSTENVTTTKTETIAGNSVDVFAYRLDFLSLLPTLCEGDALNFSLVNYHNAQAQNQNITIINQDITSNPNLNAGDINPVTVIKTDNGLPPQTTCGFPLTDIATVDGLSGDGSSVTDGQRARFINATDYTPISNNTSLQSMLWIAPTVSSTQPTIPARIIRNRVNELLACIDGTAEKAFNDCCISFCSEKKSGFGDLDTELFTQYHYSDRCYFEGLFGIRFATADEIHDVRKLLRQPLGNNGHSELKLSAQGNWKVRDWLYARNTFSYSFVLRANEKVPAPFVGATVKNIAPLVDATIFWEYLHNTFDLHFVPTQKNNVGLRVSYDLYHKRTENIRLKKQFADDCLNNSNLLDACVLTKNTNVVAHKLQIHFFYDYSRCKKRSIGFYAGFNTVFAGNNVPKERDWLLGINLHF